MNVRLADVIFLSAAEPIAFLTMENCLLEVLGEKSSTSRPGIPDNVLRRHLHKSTWVNVIIKHMHKQWIPGALSLSSALGFEMQLVLQLSCDNFMRFDWWCQLYGNGCHSLNSRKLLGCSRTAWRLQ